MLKAVMVGAEALLDVGREAMEAAAHISEADILGVEMVAMPGDHADRRSGHDPRCVTEILPGSTCREWRIFTAFLSPERAETPILRMCPMRVANTA